MSLAMTIFSMIAAWMAISLAMLWGVLRIARRHQSYAQDTTVPHVTKRQSPVPRSLLLSTSST
ncbi:hypothetical protein [Pseudomonas fluorescens]|uniref:hypothetical protein n=1 Tax=Pseudomonas fluorescens TaxID=294 RepID=UPI001242F7B2|nr:hypothetical protein [Pseudomonas fluorescens]